MHRWRGIVTGDDLVGVVSAEGTGIAHADGRSLGRRSSGNASTVATLVGRGLSAARVGLARTWLTRTTAPEEVEEAHAATL
jgi:hypothetical protein